MVPLLSTSTTGSCSAKRLSSLSPLHDLGPSAIPAQMKNFTFPRPELQEIPLTLSLHIPLTRGTTIHCLSRSIICQLADGTTVPLPMSLVRMLNRIGPTDTTLNLLPLRLASIGTLGH